MSKVSNTNQDVVDNELINKFIAGDEASFEVLIKEYETKVYSLALKLTKNTEDAEEVLQDVFVTIYKKLESFEGKSKFSSWLYRITVNAAFMKLRKNKQEKSVLFEDLALGTQNKAINAVSEQEESSYDTLLNSQLNDHIRDAVDSLPEEYRSVFILRDIDGLSNKDVSSILDLSIPAVKSRLHRSRLILRKKLQSFYTEFNGQDIQAAA